MKTKLLGTALLVVLGGCGFGNTDVDLGGKLKPLGNEGDGFHDNLVEPDGDPSAAPRCDMGKRYVGFGNTPLEVGRADADIGVNQGRLKPYSALREDYTRVLGAKPALIDASASTFGETAARWWQEPQASSISVFTAFRVAFQGCLNLTSGSAYGTAPSAATAETRCREFSRKFWSRTPEPQEVSACVQVATVDSAKETNANRRWAYTCAAVLSATGFLTY